MRLRIDSEHEERVLAQPGARAVQRYPGFVVVELAVEPEGVPRAAWERVDDPRIYVHGRPVAVEEGAFDLDSPHVLVRFAGPVHAEWRRALERAGVELGFLAPPFGACVRLPAGFDLDALRSRFPFVVGARPYEERHCARDVAAVNAAERRERGALPGVVDLVCFRREERAAVEAELARRGVEVLARSSSKLRVRFSGDLAELREIVGVKLVGPARAPVLASSAALAQTLGLELIDATTPRWTGRGQIVAVADTGLDRGSATELHPDLASRVRTLASWPINPSWDAFAENPRADDGGADRASGHGTWIAGLVAGSGAACGGKHRGIAPEATLVFQALEVEVRVKPQHASQLSSGFYLGGRPLDLRELLREAREHGARIHVNAWGDPARGAYTDDCFECDHFLAENQDALVLFAAGNDGADRDGNRAVDRASLYAPASAKNVVAVGATEGPTSGVGLRTTWGGTDPTVQLFRNPADRADPISGEPDRVALLSSCGPTADGRIKPDLCAPGTNLAAARSQATAQAGWGLASPMPLYQWWGGTSGSTAVAGGFFALLRQAWTEERGAAPSGVALKALAILGALPVLARGVTREEGREVAGFGRVHLAGALPSAARSIRLVDEREAGLETGDVREIAFATSTAGAFRAVLAWYDAPGERLVDDLDLELVDEHGRKTWGNHRAGEAGAPDRANTVEVIDVPCLAPGRYRLRVVAANVPAGAQRFALAFTAPRAMKPEVAPDALSGIGKRTADRLRAGGVASLADLRGKSRAELESLAGSKGVRLAALEARLAVVFAALDAGLAPEVPRELALERALDPAAPDGVDAATWTRARAALLALTLAFDKARLGDVTLGQLFE